MSNTAGLYTAMVVASLMTGSGGQLPAPNSSVKPACPVSNDEKYAYTPEAPVQVGGSPVYGAARQRRYLDTLRGPDGQAVQYKRVGQSRGPDGTIVDAYEVTHEGRDKSITLYLDWYHYNLPKAPRGLTCAGAFGLGIPPLNPFQEMDDVRIVGMAAGAAKEFAPIPLSIGDVAYGVIYDRFRLYGQAVREAASKGEKLDPQNPPRALMQQGMVIVAHALTCGERTVQPKSIEVIAANGAAMPKNNQVETTDVARLLYGYKAPPNSLALTFPLAAPRGNDSIRITYSEAACGSDASQVTVRLTPTPGRPIEMTPPTLPAGVTSDEPVLLQVLVDLDGAAQKPTYVGGPPELRNAAIEAMGRWRFEPVRINGAPIATGALLQVRFTPSK